jgi:hypothetical protein
VTGTSRRAAAETAHLDALGRLQFDVLRMLLPGMNQANGDGYVSYLEEAVALARGHGFKPLGGGSSRFAVELETGCRRSRDVAKIAYSVEGLLLNLQEAIFWLAARPRGISRYLAPSLLLAPTLVLIQERVEVCGPPLVERIGASRKRERELDKKLDPNARAVQGQDHGSQGGASAAR